MRKKYVTIEYLNILNKMKFKNHLSNHQFTYI